MISPSAPAHLSLPGNPVFIVGYPRSGTTLLQSFLSTFPRFFSFPETHFFNVIRPAMAMDDHGCLVASGLKETAAAIFAKSGVRFDDSEIECLKKACLARCVPPKEIFETLVGALLRKHHPGEPFDEPFRWVEKTPNHAYFLDEISAGYPDALFLNILRHPVAAASSRRRAFAANRDTAAAELARLWNRSVTAAEEFHRLHPGIMHTLRYEDLTADPAGAMAGVASFLDVPFRAEQLGEAAGHGRQLRHDWETWKGGVESGEVFDGNKEHFSGAPLADLLVIQKECRAAMERWGYSPFRPLRQRCYELTGWPGPGVGRRP